MKNPLQSIKDAKLAVQEKRESFSASYRAFETNIAAAKKVSVRKDIGTLSHELAAWFVHKSPMVAVASAIGVGSMIGSHLHGNLSSTIKQNSKRLLQHPSVLGFVKGAGAKVLLQALNHHRSLQRDVV